MALYECTFICRQDLSAQEVHKIADRIATIFSDMQSKILKREYWGLRVSAYEVKKNAKGHYTMFGVEANKSALDEFTRQCAISDDIIRSAIIKVDSIGDDPSVMMQAPANPISSSAYNHSEV